MAVIFRWEDIDAEKVHDIDWSFLSTIHHLNVEKRLHVRPLYQQSTPHPLANPPLRFTCSLLIFNPKYNRPSHLSCVFSNTSVPIHFNPRLPHPSCANVFCIFWEFFNQSDWSNLSGPPIIPSVHAALRKMIFSFALWLKVHYMT